MDPFPRTRSRKGTRTTGAAASPPPSAATAPVGTAAQAEETAAVAEEELKSAEEAALAEEAWEWSPEGPTGVNSPAMWETAVQQLKVGDMVMCRWRDGNLRPAKILHIRQDPAAGDGEEYEYYVHYSECESILLRLRRPFHFLFSGYPLLCSWLKSCSELIMVEI